MRQLAIAVAILALWPGLAAAQPLPPHQATLTVHGHGEVRVPPDHARVAAKVVTRAATLEAATAEHRERAERAAKALHDMASDGVAIEQSTFALNEIRTTPRPNASQRDDKPEYQATTTFELKLARIDAVDRAVTALASTGLFEVRSLRFGIGDDNPGLDTARRNAVADARSRATTYAQAAGVQLGDILRIEDGGGPAPREFSMNAPVASSVKVIPPKALTLSASVTMTWTIKP
jgi:uncharacterized protein YggE